MSNRPVADPSVDRVVVACIRCAVDRSWRLGWHLGAPELRDECVSACVEVATALLTADGPVPSEVLQRCAAACDAVGSDVGTLSPSEYAECARRCRELAAQLAPAAV